MTGRLKREQFESIIEMHRAIEKKRARLEVLQELATCVPAIRTDKEQVQTSTVDKSMLAADRAVDLEREIKRDELELEGMQLEVADMIDGAPIASEDRELMHYRFVRGLHWNDVGRLMNYSADYMRARAREILDLMFGGEE